MTQILVSDLGFGVWSLGFHKMPGGEFLSRFSGIKLVLDSGPDLMQNCRADKVPKGIAEMKRQLRLVTAVMAVASTAVALVPGAATTVTSPLENDTICVRPVQGAAGTYALTWGHTDVSGPSIAGGAYFTRLCAAAGVVTARTAVME
jgi:hypothetical protein